MAISRVSCQERIPKTIHLANFDTRSDDRCQHRTTFGGIETASQYQSFHLTDFEGASIVVDVQDGGSRRTGPRFDIRLRIDKLRHDSVAIVKEDIEVCAGPPEENITHLTVAQMKQKLRERGESASMRGKTRKEEFQELVRNSNERLLQNGPSKCVAKVGDKGIIVKRRAGNTVDIRFAHWLRGNNLVEGVPGRMFDEVEPKPSTGEALIGKRSTYQIKGGAITFKSGYLGKEQEYFLAAPEVSAYPGVLVPWTEAFMGGEENNLFTSAGSSEINVLAKLQLVFTNHHDRDEEDHDDFETPGRKSKRPRMDA